ncbi:MULTISPECIES: glycerophosphodiester phosphodiesterase family protein [unclassified Novosphingobium]|uniref:glycerophosphodiester phosphodiesterase family protein n=1 Tax=unclassified Novosphingobium TaxID=2644732 RepID=UPI001358BB09|nr:MULTISPECIES: glycerophosphodiester phosphodiesterase family protein [unclassified Novosphingobium]
MAPAAAQDFAKVALGKAELERRLAGPDGSVMVVAHRGCWHDTSENSVDAIKACIKAGIDMVELDVRASRDGKLMLMHDPALQRMTDGVGKVEDLDWAQLRKLRLREGRGDGTPLSKRRIPTLKQALRAAKDKILINVDAKAPLSAAVLAQVDAAGMRAQVLFKAEAPVATILAAAPWAASVRFQPILRQPYIHTDPAAAIAAYDTLRPVSYEIDVKDEAFTALVAPIVHTRCARYWIDGLAGRAFDDREAVADPDLVWGKLIALGVDAVQTDEPIALKTYLQRTNAAAYRCEPPAE